MAGDSAYDATGSTAGVVSPDDTAPFVARMSGLWGSTRARGWFLAALPELGDKAPSARLLSSVLDAVPARFHAVSVAEDFTRARTVVEVGATMLFPGAAGRVADAVVRALGPSEAALVARVRPALRGALRTIREPLGLVAFVADGDRVAETKLYWTCASMDERAAGGFSCEPSDERSASDALAALAAAAETDPVDPSLVRTMYAAGAGLDGAGLDAAGGAMSDVKPYFAPRPGRGAASVRAAFSRRDRPVRARGMEAMIAAVAGNPGCEFESLATEGDGEEVKVYVSTARIDRAGSARAALRDLCSAWDRRDMGEVAADLVTRLERVGGRVSSVGFDVAGDGRAEVKVYLWPRFDYDARGA